MLRFGIPGGLRLPAMALASVLLMAGSQSALGAPQLVLTFWHTQGTAATDLTGLIKAFEAAHPDIAVRPQYMGNYDEMAQKVLASIAGRTPPNVAQLGQRYGIPQVADSGALVPLDGLLTSQDRDDVWPALWDRFRYRGHVWAMPFNVSTPSLWYNKTAFRAAGLDPEHPPRTWEDLARAAQALTKRSGDRTEQWGFETAADTPWYFLAMVWQAGGSVVDAAGHVRLTGAEPVRVLQFWHDLVHTAHAMPPAQHQTAEDDFTAGRAAMLFASIAARGDYEQKVGTRFDLGDAPLPCRRTCAVGIGGNALGIFHSNPDAEQAAWAFVRFLTSSAATAEYSVRTGYVPIRRSAVSLPVFQGFLERAPLARTGIDQLRYLHAQGVNPADAMIWTGLVEAIEQVETAPTADPGQVLGRLQARVDEYLRTYKP